MIVWSIGRLSSVETGVKVKKLLIEALQDPYWKVRAAACTAIANFKEQMADKGLPILMKLLSDGQQNKQLVAETIISMGP
jgi:HEAT repeat protein